MRRPDSTTTSGANAWRPNALTNGANRHSKTIPPARKWIARQVGKMVSGEMWENGVSSRDTTSHQLEGRKWCQFIFRRPLGGEKWDLTSLDKENSVAQCSSRFT